MDSTDFQLFARATAGDREAKQALIALHRPHVLATCRNHLRDHQDAIEDVCQETFVRLLANLDRIDPDKLPGWLSTVAINQCRSYRRKLAQRPRVERGLSVEDDPAERITDRLAVGAILAGIGGGHAAILTSHYLQDSPVSVIESERGLATGSGKVLLHRARRAARSVAESLDLRSLIPLPFSRWWRDAMHRIQNIELMASVAGNALAAGMVALCGWIAGPALDANGSMSDLGSGSSGTQALIQRGAGSGAVVLNRPALGPVDRSTARATTSRDEQQATDWAEVEQVVVPMTGRAITTDEPNEPSRYQIGASMGTELEGADGVVSIVVYGETDERGPAYEAACDAAEASPALTYCRS